MLVFVEREKQDSPVKNPQSRNQNQLQIQPRYSINSGVHTQATLAQDERSHHCTISAQGGFELNVEGNSLLLQFTLL